MKKNTAPKTRYTFTVFAVGENSALYMTLLFNTANFMKRLGIRDILAPTAIKPKGIISDDIK